MGIFTKSTKLNDFATQSAYSGEPLIQSIWSPNTLQKVLFPNVDSNAYPVTVDEAISIPAVNAALGIYCGVCSRFPLTATNNAAWLTTTTQASVTPQLRIAKLVEDLIFFNAAVLYVTRDEAGYVNDAVRVPPHRWSTDDKGNVLIDQKPLDQNSIVFIAGLKTAGFLTAARGTVRHAAALERTALNRSVNPSPITVIAETEKSVASEEEIDEMLADYGNARRQENGGLVFQPFGLEVKDYGGSDSASQMLTSARMQARTDLANHLNISSSYLDGLTGNSDVYSNSLQTKSELLHLSLMLFTEPIANRLSQDDVTPPGVKVTFDYSEFEVSTDAKGNIGTAVESTPND
ncbi:phage portal protein [Paenarthrobacter sp. NPDC057355]|uniref:phage portal protein n=1 Tax=Paenarthrobacter sp. NPDC057355 TaxID=3346105 RepID=UPI00363CEB23